MTARTDPRQSSLLDQFEPMEAPVAPAPGGLNIDRELRGVMAQALKDCPFSRAEVAARMSDLTADPISEHMLNKWTAPSADGWRFPVEYVPAFEEATGTDVLIELLARKRGRLLMTPREGRDAEIGAARREMARLQSHIRGLMRSGS